MSVALYTFEAISLAACAYFTRRTKLMWAFAAGLIILLVAAIADVRMITDPAAVVSTVVINLAVLSYFAHFAGATKLSWALVVVAVVAIAAEVGGYIG